jgi:hypothetical protein
VLSPFSEISCSGAYNIFLIKGDSPSVTLTGTMEQLEKIKTEVKGKTLHIQTKENGKEWVESHTVPSLRITYRSIETIYSSGSSDFSTEGVVTSKTLSLKHTGSGKMLLSLDADMVDVGITGSADVELVGKASKLEVSISGSGKALAQKLVAENCTVSISGSGEAEVSAEASLNISISGSGRVRYAGNPAKFEQQVSGSGKVSKLR